MKHNSDRIAIFVFYDHEGILEPYVINLLDGMRDYVDFIYTVVNGFIQESGKELLELHSDKLLLRENKGFDAGAIKDAIADLTVTDMLKKYDELVIYNDTFWGFFYPLSDFFDGTAKEPEVDFWGFTEWPGNASDDRIHIPEHLQSYFLYIKRRMLHSKDFLKFWNDMPYCRDFSDVLTKYEQSFTQHFNERGYQSKAYYTVEKLGEKKEFNKIPYFVYAYDLVEKLHYPILKCKAFSIEGNMADCERLIHYLEDNHLYDTRLIRDHAARFANERSYFNLKKIGEFCRKYKKIYVYGAGNFGQNVRAYLEAAGYVFGGFIVTEKKTTNTEEVQEFKSFKLDPDSGIIIGLIPKYTREVLEEIKGKIPDEQIFTGQYWK